MKIRCSVCETAEATVLCCADEAALCGDCDHKVHAANKLATKHQRVSLCTSSSHMPKCDICQETVGYFFCLEDRALLCRKCDIAIHSVNSLVSAHQRFLMTGVGVGNEAAEPGSSSSGGRTQSGEKVSDADNRAVSKRSAPVPTTTLNDRAGSVQNGTAEASRSNKRTRPMSVIEYAKMQPLQSVTLEDLTQSSMNVVGGSAAGNLSQWPMDEYFGLSEFSQTYGLTDNGSSKADSGKLGESDSSSILRSFEDGLDSDDQLGQVPDICWAVPQAPSPPTASGLYWPKNSQHLADSAAFVPNISWSRAPNYRQNLPENNSPKRRRQL